MHYLTTTHLKPQLNNTPLKMTPTIKKTNMISQIVRLKQVVKGWKNKSYRPSCTSSDGQEPDSSRTPAGSVGILVGPTRMRFVIPTRFLNLPVFVDLLNQTEEEFGYQVNGPVVVQCEPDFLEQVLHYLDEDEERFRGFGLDGFSRMASEMSLDRSNCKESCSGSPFAPLLSKTKA